MLVYSTSSTSTALVEANAYIHQRGDGSVFSRGCSCLNICSQEELLDDMESFVQMSTPVKKKKRRISTRSGAKIERFSIIPPLERSFIALGDEKFEVSPVIFHNKRVHVRTYIYVYNVSTIFTRLRNAI